MKRWPAFAVLIGEPCAAQSALEPASREAERIATLTWWLYGGAAVIWVAVLALALWCVRAPPEDYTPRRERLIIAGGGAVLPTVVLAVLLVYGLAMLPDLIARAPAGSVRVAVDGELWWWRVRYPTPGGEVTLANEIHLPVGVPAELSLATDNVIHAFWVPALGGKMDLIPGRVTRLVITPTRTGTFRGACAEYCGTAHALMRFVVVVHERAEFERWLSEQARPAVRPSQPLAARGADAFVKHGCTACHTIRGTAARGVVGPDLTHVGSRRSVAAGTLGPGAANLRRWIEHTHALKPEAPMPHFGMLPPEDLDALAAYLEALR